MKRIIIIVITIAVSLCLIQLSDAKKKKRRYRRLNDKGVPTVEMNVCNGLCRGNERIYIYDGVTVPSHCESIGGEMFTHQGYELISVCKVVHPKRCKMLEGEVGEFHFPLLSKNYTHLGCEADMTPEQCREVLRKEYASKPTPNKYFMNNIGCLVH